MNILITGGAGFIGSHLTDELLLHGHRVVVLDNLDPQVHGEYAVRPEYLSNSAEMVVGDVRNPETVLKSLRDIDAVYHLAAKVGVGQSAYQPIEYTSTNNLGTATLLHALQSHPVKKLIVASSMSVYGEGFFTTTPEEKTPKPTSIYALSKYHQEQMCLLSNLPTIALRFFNVYGSRQSLSNPYTGVLAIFANRLMNNLPPIVYEDGLQTRDFVHVSDIVQGLVLALNHPNTDVFNIGTGVPTHVLEVAYQLADYLQGPPPEITGKHRVGDIRHCVADISKAHRVLGYEPKINFNQGLGSLVQWLKTQPSAPTIDATQELLKHGLI